MAIGKTDDKHYKAIADAIRSNCDVQDVYKPEEMAQGVHIACSTQYYKGSADGEEIGYANGLYEGTE